MSWKRDDPVHFVWVPVMEGNYTYWTPGTELISHSHGMRRARGIQAHGDLFAYEGLDGTWRNRGGEEVDQAMVQLLIASMG